MQRTSDYISPLGRILLAADDIGLTGLWFEEQKYFASVLGESCRDNAFPVLNTAKAWLDIYFSGSEPGFMPPLHFIGTDFQVEVWNILCSIPYGKTVTYGDIAAQLAQARGIKKMSARAVGGAVGRNNISVIVPCHRVVGRRGLTGYAGGVEKKAALLRLEGALDC